MKIKKTITILLILILSVPVIAQKNQALDTVYLLGRKKLIVKVKGVTSSSIRYFDPKTSESKILKRKQIQKIMYASGRKEVFNKPVVMVIKDGDWKTVIVTDRKNDVTGLYELGKVKAKSSPGGRSAKAARKSAMIRLQKKAANLGGIIVLLTHEESIGGFGEPPAFLAEGIAYGYEPPKEEPKKEKSAKSKKDSKKSKKSKKKR
ncbi:MAG: hypothetical protein MI739_14725 [Bacteroidales bacterium]|nr:hypothetical protein [Bacteroidales bacterium]